MAKPLSSAPVPNKPRSGSPKFLRELLAAIVLAAVSLAVYFALTSWPARDFFSGLGYEPSVDMSILRDALGLTSEGARIFAAAAPVLEDSAAFNNHCESHRREVSLLGCYTGGKIYVYEISQSELADSNKVTLAHELLHAAWERLSTAELREIEPLLREVEAGNSDFFADELSAYPSDARLEEVWARAGTKLRALPAALEAKYARYFSDRSALVAYYETYQAPFAALRAKNSALEAEISAARSEIAANRERYLADQAAYNADIAAFNSCAASPGCFASDALFEQRRAEILAAGDRLEAFRLQINAQIDQNNARVEEYLANQAALGELSDAMNSNAEETIKKENPNEK